MCRPQSGKECKHICDQEGDVGLQWFEVHWIAEGVVSWERNIMLREFGIWVIMLKCVEDLLVLVKSVAGILLLMDLHLEKPMDRAKDFHN